MKKVLAFFMTAVMVCSMGVTTAFGATAKASQDKVAVNGQQIKMQAYNINGYNYFKLRDVAAAVNHSPASFYVGWDAQKQMITMDLGFPYDGSSDLGKPFVTGTKTANPGNGDVLVMKNGTEKVVHLSAYNIDGYNYFKLRDLGEVAGFEVGWDAGQKCVNILSYSDAPPADLSGDSLGFGVPEEPVKPTMVYDSFYVDVNESVGYWYDNYVFFGDNVFVSWSAGGEGGRVKFTNCEFNCDLIVAGASEDSWVTLENCVFNNGHGRYFAE